MERWSSAAAQTVHLAKPHMLALVSLKKKYISGTDVIKLSDLKENEKTGVFQKEHAGSAFCERSVQEVLQLLGAAGMTQLTQRLSLDLADTLAGDMELLAHLFQRTGAAVLDAKAQLQHLLLAGGSEWTAPPPAAPSAA